MPQDENMRRWMVIGLAAFGITGIICEIILTLVLRVAMWSWTSSFLIFILSAIVGVAVFFASMKLHL
jgi:hypothetical protein